MAPDDSPHSPFTLETSVSEFSGDLSPWFLPPVGVLEYDWPPIQVRYLGDYLRQLGCKSVVMESHYIDRDYIDDFALFYSRSLRGYPNHCKRLHFFSNVLTPGNWRDLILRAGKGNVSGVVNTLLNDYLGFSVIRPLPCTRLGRTVLQTFGPHATEGDIRHFTAVRDYEVHLSGFDLSVRGLAFQQQDGGVSACATTALWCSIHQSASKEGLREVTPAEITQAASRYFLPGGRSLPSEGLTIEQLCEATRAAGLAPVYISGISFEGDRAQLLALLDSGFAPVLAIQKIDGDDQQIGHAVCASGFKLGAVAPQTDSTLHFRDGATALKGLYIHDDRLGPYASADLLPYTVKTPVGTRIRTQLRVRWPQQPVEVEHSMLVAIVVPVPAKLRLPVSRMRELGMSVAEWAGVTFPEFERAVTLNCRYRAAVEYKRSCYDFRLSDSGLYELTSGVVLSRYLGVIEICVPDGPLFDVLLDSTETTANPSVIGCVRRMKMPTAAEGKFRSMAKILGGIAIW